MAISGLVVTLAEDAAIAESAAASLGRDARLTVGDRFGRRLAVVAETPDVASDRDMIDELRMMPGVVYVDVTFVGGLDAKDSQRDASKQGCGERNHDNR